MVYSKILEFLTGLVDSKSSGTLFIHSDCNHAITVALDKGHIIALYFGGRRGRKAIPLISKISSGSYRFDESKLVETSQDLPSTPELLNLLRSSAAAVEFSHSAVSPAAGNEAIEEELKNILCQELKKLLAEHMGPIADVVFDDAASEVGDFCSTPQLTQDLINKLSEEIDDAGEVEQFRKKAFLTLNKILQG